MKKDRKPREAAENTERILPGKNRLTFYAVIFVLTVMAAAFVLTALIFVILNAVGVFRGTDLPVLGISVIALFVLVMLGAGISAAVSNIFVKPLDELVRVMQVVAGGDFTVRVRERRNANPLSKLCRNFNSMVDELSGIEMFRRDFINTFSHEFKTPMISIMGFARQLRDGDPTAEEQREYADIIISECERLTNMSQSILLLSKFESQNIVSDLTSFRVDEQIRHCILLFEKQWTAKRLDLTVDLEEATFTSNEEMLSHIWINLISNAVKFTPEGGRIGVALKKTDGGITVAVSDSGCGMDEETKKHIFDKFFQGDRSHSSEGSGLGLSVVSRILDLMNGTVEVESAPGEGSVFTVTLPEPESPYNG